MGRDRDPKQPARHKTVVVTWLALFPLVTLTLWAFDAQLEHLPLVLRALVLTAILVPAMTYAVMPLMNRAFGRWLRPPGDAPERRKPGRDR